MDLTSPFWDYNAALLFGAITIVFHSWANFNRPSQSNWDGLGDLVNLLNPSDVRARQVVNRAFVFYVLILLVIFLVLCSYFQVLAPFLGNQFASLVDVQTDTVGAKEIPQAGFDPDFLARIDEQEQGKSPSVPLSISLAMVGLAPRIGVLRELENRLRLAAHWMSGIPTRLIRGADSLSRQTLAMRDEAEAWIQDPDKMEPDENRFLIGPRDWKRYVHYLRFLGSHHIPIDTYEMKNHLDIVVAFSNWILNDRLDCVRDDNWSAHDVTKTVEAEVDRYMADMDRLTLFDTTAEGDGSGTLKADLSLGTWKAMEDVAKRTARNVSMLVFLLDEHGALETNAYIDPGAYDSERLEQVVEQTKILRNRLNAAQSHADWSEMTFALWGRSFFLIVIAAGLAGAVAPLLNLQSLAGGINIWSSILWYAQNAIVIYALPLIAALAMRQMAIRGGRWQNSFRSGWVNWGFQLGEIWLTTALIALFCVVAQDFAALMGRYGVEAVAERAVDAIVGSLLYLGPSSLVGPTLSLGVLILIDAWESGRRRADEAQTPAWVVRWRMLRAVAYSVFALGLVGAIGKLSGSLYASDRSLARYLEWLRGAEGTDLGTCSGGNWEVTQCYFGGFWPFSVYAAETAMLIGLAVFLVVWASLQGDYRTLVYPDEPDDPSSPEHSDAQLETGAPTKVREVA